MRCVESSVSCETPKAEFGEEDAVEEKRMEMDVQIQSSAEPPSYRAA
jgi:hypothetical protein